MNALHLLALLFGLAAGVGGTLLVLRAWRGRREVAPPSRRILFPFVGAALSEPALDAALRIARAEGATVVPAYLAAVPMPLALDAPLGRTCDVAFSVFEAIEQRAARVEVPVDARIARGRSTRHALREIMAGERFDRIVIAAATRGTDGFSADDVAWLLRNAPGEVLVVRPANGSVLAVPTSVPAPA